jgi:hypothetical protein
MNNNEKEKKKVSRDVYKWVIIIFVIIFIWLIGKAVLLVFR